jgi:hypothetical protein
MLGEEIVSFFRTHPVLRNHFRGVYAADQIKSVRLKNRTFAIVNTDRLRGEGGKHWYCLAKLENRYELFDPLGISQAEVQERLGNARFCYFNASPVQGEESTLCGYFCCYWVYVRLYNADRKFSEVLKWHFGKTWEGKNKLIWLFCSISDFE